MYVYLLPTYNVHDIYLDSYAELTWQVYIVMQAQSIATVGASDVVFIEAPNGEVCIVIASREDNEGNPNVDSVVLRWNEGRFEPFQTLETIGASAAAAFYIGDSLYLAFSSFTDTRYNLYTIKPSDVTWVLLYTYISDLQYMYGEMDSLGCIII